MPAVTQRRRRSQQRAFVFRTWGGKRKRAGRKPTGNKAGVSHLAREPLAARYPVHVTVKVQRGIANLRKPRVAACVQACLRAGCERLRMRVVHYSLQGDHLHLLCEASDGASLSRGMQGLCIRIAKRLNARLGRHGKVFADRFHSRILKTPREVYLALRYVLLNAQHHDRQQGRLIGGLDPLTSWAYFDGWAKSELQQQSVPTGPPPVTAARTWLLRSGWRRHGLLRVDDRAAAVAR